MPAATRPKVLSVARRDLYVSRRSNFNARRSLSNGGGAWRRRLGVISSMPAATRPKIPSVAGRNLICRNAFQF